MLSYQRVADPAAVWRLSDTFECQDCFHHVFQALLGFQHRELDLICILATEQQAAKLQMGYDSCCT